MKFLSTLMRYFVYVTTGIVFVFIVISLMYGLDSISLQQLIHIPCAALATALASVIVYPQDEMAKREFTIRVVLHCLLLCVIMIFLGVTFEWITLNLQGVMTMVLSTAAVYAFTFVGMYLSSKSEAGALNKALKTKRNTQK